MKTKQRQVKHTVSVLIYSFQSIFLSWITSIKVETLRTWENPNITDSRSEQYENDGIFREKKQIATPDKQEDHAKESKSSTWTYLKS